MNSLVGNKEQQDFLKKLSLKEDIPHAFIFCGEDQIGKRGIALSFAKSLICGCGDCPICTMIDKGMCPDICSITPQDKIIEIDKIRDLQKFLSLKSYFGGRKVAIIDDAHIMRSDAQNSLLKTLEEPSSNSILILITSYPEMLLGTIRSRAERINFNLTGKDEIRECLIGLGASRQEADEICLVCSGRAGKAIELFKNEEKKFFLFKTLEDIKSLEKKGFNERFEYAKTISEDSEKMEEVLDIFERYFRGVMLFKLFKNQSKISKTKKIIESVQETKYYFKNTNTNKKLLLENLLIKL